MRRPQPNSRETRGIGRPDENAPRRSLPRLRTRSAKVSALGLVAIGLTGGLLATSSAHATPTPPPPSVDLTVLLIGEGANDPTTQAWDSGLTQEGVPFTEVDGTGPAGSEAVNLPALTTTFGTTTVGNFNAVVFADSPANDAAAGLAGLDSYEAQYQVRQLDGDAFPSTTIGATDVTSRTLDGTVASLPNTATLTNPAGTAAFPGLAGNLAFDNGTHGYPAPAASGFTWWITGAGTTDSLGGGHQRARPSRGADESRSIAAPRTDRRFGKAPPAGGRRPYAPRSDFV
jgi:hypothetical protein